MNYKNVSKTHLFSIIAFVIFLISVPFLIQVDMSSFSNFVSTNSSSFLKRGLEHKYIAPEISGIYAWLNSNPLQLKSLRGRVVLIDFWTYSCINCVRTLPHLTKWYNDYKDKGFVLIGIHSPEFEFEKVRSNVQYALDRYKINYPVAMDNNYETWNNFDNRYWPAHYLIDSEGYVVYSHFGEGEYDVTENNIRYLLGLGKINENDSGELSNNFNQTAETYLGYTRSTNFASRDLLRNSPSDYRYPEIIYDDQWALNGKWIIKSEKIISGDKKSSLKINFYAKKVFLVMGNSGSKSIHLRIMLNDRMPENESGKDAPGGVLQIDQSRLYELINLEKAGRAVLEIISDEPGLEAYAFTFG